jgi:hypothetical protein
MRGKDDTPTCAQLEAAMADLLDDTLTGRGLEGARAHLAACEECRQLLELARAGKQWLGTVEDVEPPANMVHNILTATSAAAFVPAPVERPVGASANPVAAAWQALQELAQQPRLVMTAAMAFFSFSMLVHVTGASLDDLRGLKPSALLTRVSQRYHEIGAAAVRYYENSRFLREVEVRLQDLRDAASADDADDAPASPPASPQGRDGEPVPPEQIARALPEDSAHV